MQSSLNSCRVSWWGDWCKPHLIVQWFLPCHKRYNLVPRHTGVFVFFKWCLGLHVTATICMPSSYIRTLANMCECQPSSYLKRKVRGEIHIKPFQHSPLYCLIVHCIIVDAMQSQVISHFRMCIDQRFIIHDFSRQGSLCILWAFIDSHSKMQGHSHIS